ncbi:family 2 glycosyl transferase [Calothrix sp. NIES-4071]|nr:family 2 glycosyl transferase [Calothrix sp. NIES-4071]BAZ55193.1 family 2 glycosyl transferase [Calothrix sp. NIES-4105]
MTNNIEHSNMVSSISSKKLEISVIIPVFNGGSSFKSCLSNLASAMPPPCEVIVVSDGDTDNSWLVAEQFGAVVLRLTTCNGPAKARNVGAQNARGDILFFIDADVTIYPDIIERVEKIFKENPELAAIIGSYDDAPLETNFLSQYKNLFHHYTHQTANEEAFTFWGACGAIRRDVFLAVGGFDESYRRPSIEDIELGYRLAKAGHKIRLCKDLQVKHLKHWFPLSLLKAEFFYRALPWVELILREGAKNDLNLGITSRLSVIAVYALTLALIASLWAPQFLIVVFGLSLLLVCLNLPVYRFFSEKRGFWFALRVIPWHWFYYLYGGLAVVIGTAHYFWYQNRFLKPDIINASKTSL